MTGAGADNFLKIFSPAGGKIFVFFTILSEKASILHKLFHCGWERFCDCRVSTRKPSSTVCFLMFLVAMLEGKVLKF